MRELKNNNNKELKLRKISKKIIRVILILFVVIMIMQVAVFSAYLVKSKGSVSKAAINIVEDVVGKQEPIFCLILGISEDTNAILTDTIMVSAYNPNSQKAFLISIPRDTYIGKDKNNPTGLDKINSLYKSNSRKILDEVNRITGLKLENYIVIKTKLLREIVDSLGGIEFYVPIDMNYDDQSQNLHIHLKEGTQILDGKKAEQLVRFRHNNNGTSYPLSYGDNDIGRMRTQREFIKALANNVIKTKSISKIEDMIKSFFNNLETNFSLSKLILYIPYCIEFNLDNLITDTLPGTPKQLNNLWFYENDFNKTNELFKELIQELELTENEINEYTNIR